MQHLRLALLAVRLSIPTIAVGDQREWTDETGNFKLTAEFVARNDQTVVLQKDNGELLMVDLEQLSEADRKYVNGLGRASGGDVAGGQVAPGHTWKLNNGVTIEGSVVEHGRREIKLRRYAGKVYVNDRLYSTLPEFYQQLVPAIVSHFEEAELKTGDDLNRWLRRIPGGNKSYTVEGVMLQLASGDLYGVPFFLFNDRDAKLLRPGWDEWVAAEEDAQYQEDLGLQLRSQVIAQRRNQEASLQMQRLQLHLGAYDAGLFDLWRVSLAPPPGRGMPIQVVVPGRNSAQASQEALRRYPGCRVVAAAKVNRY